MDAVKTLLNSKRFVVTTITVLVLASFVVAGKMPLADFQAKLAYLGGLLATLYGIENAVAAHGQGFPDPVPSTPMTAVGSTTPEGVAQLASVKPPPLPSTETDKKEGTP